MHRRCRPSSGPAAVLRAAGLLLALLALPAVQAFAQSAQVPVGPRAVAMGGAFSAVADDGSALFWNPAGLPQIGNQIITGTHADLFKTGIKDNLVSFVLPISTFHAAAGDWYHSGFDDGELGFSENRIDLAYGLRVTPWLYGGAATKYLSRNTSLDGATVRKGQGVGMDLGLLATPWRSLKLALVAQDLFDTRISDPDGGSGIVYPRNVRAAAAYGFGGLGTVAFDLDDRWHFGVEAFPIEQLALRAGVQDDTQGYERATYSFGAGFRAGIFRLDYAREQHPTLDATDHFAMAMEFNFNPAQIRIEKVEAQPIYASQYKRYARDPFGSIQVRNLQEEPLSAQVSVYVPELMEAPSVQPVLLRPMAVHEIPLTAVFTDRALALGGDRNVQVDVRASYQSRRLVREDKGAVRSVAYGPGAINWGQGVEQAAAFVTTKDPAVDALARQASGTVVRMGSDPFGNRNLNFAAAMTDALASLGLAYVPDPNNPYAAISETEHAVDTIHYPHETLASRTGDCDDSTVLMAALLENVGVPTKFVDVPGHLTLLVGTGVHERNQVALGVDETLCVVADEQVWIPVETTELSKGFAHAWRTGADAYAGWQARGRVNLVDVGQAQRRFEPVSPPGARPSIEIDEDDLRARIELDAGIVAGWKREFMGSRFGDVQQLDASESAIVEVAHVYYLAGSYDRARERLEQALVAARSSSRLLNNLAVVCAAQGDTTEALRYGEKALEAGPSDEPAHWLNRGLLLYVYAADQRGMKISLPARWDGITTMARGVELAGGFAAAIKLLGLGGAKPEYRGESGATADEARLMLYQAVMAATPLEGRPQDAAAQRIEDSSPHDPAGWWLRNSAARAEAAAQVHQYMYWRR